MIFNLEIPSASSFGSSSSLLFHFISAAAACDRSRPLAITRRAWCSSSLLLYWWPVTSHWSIIFLSCVWLANLSGRTI